MKNVQVELKKHCSRLQDSDSRHVYFWRKKGSRQGCTTQNLRVGMQQQIGLYQNPNIPKPRYPRFQISQNSDIEISEYPDMQISKLPSQGHAGIIMSCCMSGTLFGCPYLSRVAGPACSEGGILNCFEVYWAFRRLNKPCQTAKRKWCYSDNDT